MTQAQSALAEGVLFEGGPPDKFQVWLGLIRQDRRRPVLRAALVLLLGWVPLAALSFAHGDLLNRTAGSGFLWDFAAQARFLIAAPLLVLAEVVCLPQLSAIAREFLVTGIVAEASYPDFQRALDSTRRLMNSTVVEFLVVLAAYALVGLLFLAKPPNEFASWHGGFVGGHVSVAPAGWWLLLVSLPLLVILELGWVWRLVLWTRFLWLMSRLPLRLIPAHPDAAAGLKFVNYSLRAFSPLGFIVAVLASGPILNSVMHDGASPAHFKFTMAGVIVAVVAIFVSPLLVFTPRLAAEKRHGTFRYGGLAAAMGREFEKKWFASRQALNQEALAASDFSATTDLYAVVANTFAMQVVPMELRDLLFLGLATLAPFIPVALLAVPLDVILDKLAGMFL
jgi:hypothetical protein